MFLTVDEERMLKGECGVIVQKSMEVLVTLGDVFGAEGMGKVTSGHVSGISYKNIGDPGLEFLEEWASEGTICRVPTTINPCGMDTDRWREMGVSEAFAEKQIRVIDAFKQLKAIESLTCTPYLIGNEPGTGEHIAWAESSAIVYANSILGARTNREGGPSALASAITGRTPMFDYHLDERRKPTHEVYVDKPIRGALEYSALGYHIAEELGRCVPLFKDLKGPGLEELKALCAGSAASGAIALYHVYGITPEEKKFRGDQYERLRVTKKDLVETIERLSAEVVDEHVCIGCPHCSLREIAEIASRVSGKKLEHELWVFTSRAVCETAKRIGYFKTIEKAGGKVFSDTCMVVSPMREIGVQGMVTNSCKAAHYIPSTCGIPVKLKSLNDCIRAGRK